MGGDGKVQVRGLSDFSLSLTETEKAINPYRMDEKESFAYQASQSTQESTSHDGSLSVKQTLHTHLTASWYQALDPATPLSLNSSKNSQNYLYHTVDNEETNATTFNYNAKGLLTSIGNHTQVNNVETVRKYVWANWWIKPSPQKSMSATTYSLCPKTSNVSSDTALRG
jgi:hypothetical protein